MIRSEKLIALLLLATPMTLQAQDVTVSISDSLVQLDAGEVLLSVMTSSLDDAGVGGYQFALVFDDRIIDVTGLEGDESLSGDMIVQGNSPHPGRLNGVGAGADTLAGAGVLVFLELSCVAEGTSEIEFAEFSFDEDQLNIDTVPGVVHCVEQVVTVDVTPASIENVGRGEQALVPVEVSSLAAAPVTGYSLVAHVDTSIAALDGIELVGSLSEGGTIESSLDAAGQLSSTVALSDSIREGGTLLFLKFRCNWIGASEVVFEEFDFDAVQIAEQVSPVTVTCFSRVAVEGEPVLPRGSKLTVGVYPNPMVTHGSFVLQSSETLPASLIVFDVLGREVARPLERSLPAGLHEVPFDATHLTAGVYFYRLLVDEEVLTGTLVIGR